MNWKTIEDNGIELLSESSQFWREAKVIQGGNRLWTAWVITWKSGGTKSNGKPKRPIMVQMENLKPQAQTRDDAQKWAEEILSFLPELQTLNHP